jgi:hypothetical protein
MPGLRLTGHEPEFPRRLTLERVTGNAELWPAALGKHTRALARNTLPEMGGGCNGKLHRPCAKDVERGKFLWKGEGKTGRWSFVVGR